MFYRTTFQDHIRVAPKLFGLPTKEAVTKQIKKKYDGFISKGGQENYIQAVVSKIKALSVKPPKRQCFVIMPFSKTKSCRSEDWTEIFNNVIKPAVEGSGFNYECKRSDGIAGNIIEDTFSKEKVLSGKDSKRTLKVGDRCRARIIAVSFKDVGNPKLGLTMRQEFLGKLEWLEEETTSPKKGKKEEKEEPEKKEKKKKE
ncbi:DNA-directed RNA polymerase [archaeon]|nr:DNA-directed RNA polymerase [archaeon]